MCVGRDAGTRICTTCPAGYYLNTPAVADNDCYEEGRGKRSGTQALVPCADTNCLECPTSSTICRKCAQTPTKYWSQGTDPTTCVTTPPASKFGIDATGFFMHWL
ncbi:UNKNOWN [Stylonychia lemnae]|uniref:Tyrosine-protein kinase ephrin type A/B receptor-like domain-containing protein n=1 Tax=Stylonychia lemnae TaxID=5949 RepID=A0A078APK3_STYLE|nr:UNKNOWN [Stylonychia lemnae]|eukprot:CDW83881.1 UNKNOWN [Stylonychia lemnae]